MDTEFQSANASHLKNVKVLFVGQSPGAMEEGKHPFVGPSGQNLLKAINGGQCKKYNPDEMYVIWNRNPHIAFINVFEEEKPKIRRNQNIERILKKALQKKITLVVLGHKALKEIIPTLFTYVMRPRQIVFAPHPSPQNSRNSAKLKGILKRLKLDIRI